MISFRDLMSRFPTGVTVVTSLDVAGRPEGMTCSSLASVCLDPPTLLVSLHAHSHTFRAIRERRCFAVNLLHDGGRRAAEVFAAPVDRFGELAWEPSPSGLPLLVDHSLAMAECTVSNMLPVGDHIVVFGEVVHLFEHGGDAPLLYGLREYSAWRGAAVLGS